MTKSDTTLIGAIYTFVLILFIFAIGLMATTNDISALWKYIFTGFMSIAITMPPAIYFWNKTVNSEKQTKTANKTTILEVAD